MTDMYPQVDEQIGGRHRAADESQRVIGMQARFHVAKHRAPGEASIFERSLEGVQQPYQAGKIALLSAVTLVEIAPGLNEGVRGVVWGAGEVASSHNPVTGAVTFGLATLAVESVGAVAAAPLLGSDTNKRFMHFLNDKTSRFRRNPDNMQFSRTTIVGATLFGGSVVGMALEHLENPETTVAESRRSGLRKAAWLTGPCAVQGALMSEGLGASLDHPVPAAAIAGGVAAAAGTKRVVGGIIRRRHSEQYQEAASKYEPGPQIEGLPDKEIRKAMRDKDTQYLSIYDETKGKHVKVPFLVPIKYAPWFNTDFLVKQGYDRASLMYSVLPQDVLAGLDESIVNEALHATTAKRGDTNVVFDFHEGHSYFGAEGLPFGEIDDLKTTDGTPAGTFHFRTHVTANESALADYEANPAVRDLSKDDIKKMFPRIWEIYADRFDDLVDDHPINGELPKRYLKKMLLSDGSITKGFFDEAGNLQAFGYIVEDLKLCEWLDADYLDNEAPEDSNKVLYFPGIAKDREFTKPISGLIMQSFTADMLRKYGSADLTFECSNISVREVPKLTELALRRSGLGQMTDYATDTYRYNVLKVQAMEADSIDLDDVAQQATNQPVMVEV